MSPPVEASIGVDNKTCVDTGNDIIDHARLKANTVLRTKGGAPIFGSRKTRLHQPYASKKPWQLVHNGDLGVQDEKHAKVKNPEAATFTKQKGHATQQMVDEGKVKEEDKEGNHQSDTAADRGGVEEQQNLNVLGWKYAARLKAYRRFMEQVHNFIIKVRKKAKHICMN